MFERPRRVYRYHKRGSLQTRAEEKIEDEEEKRDSSMKASAEAPLCVVFCYRVV